MYCNLEQGNFNNPEMLVSYLLKDGEFAEQGEVLNDGWLVCCAELIDNVQTTSNRTYYQGEYICLIDITQLKMFSTDLSFYHPDFELFDTYLYKDELARLNVYVNVAYNPTNKCSKKLDKIIRSD